MGKSEIAQFYDRLAGEYHLLFADWTQAVHRQGAFLDGLIRARSGAGARSVLDCTCGIGTQAIGLALHGYQVTATDISAGGIARAREEAKMFGVSVTFGVADVRALAGEVPGAFDVVLSFDNSLPHLLTDADMAAALATIRAKMEPTGLFLASVRDYDALARERPPGTMPGVYDEGRRISFQVWEWADDGRSYHFHQFVLTRDEAEWRTVAATARYRAWQREELTAALHGAGFAQIEWLLPDGSFGTPSPRTFYHPVVIARRGETHGQL